MDLQVFIGFDSRYRTQWNVCAASMQEHCGDYPVPIQSIGRKQLIDAGLYTRPTQIRDGGLWDDISGAPCSTDFSLARFWVPLVAGRVGWALFCDSDFLWRADVRELLNYADPKCALMVVPNKHEPTETEKMDGKAQTAYFRKNWSSLMLFNLGHAGVHRQNQWDLNHCKGLDLHGFAWLASSEIGFLPPEWNWLEGISPTSPRPSPARGEGDFEPKAVHFTRGTPDMPGHENAAYADEWMAYLPTTTGAAASGTSVPLSAPSLDRKDGEQMKAQSELCAASGVPAVPHKAARP